jgi:hypothetical protein
VVRRSFEQRISMIFSAMSGSSRITGRKSRRSMT